jgi:hypothetical protein
MALIDNILAYWKLDNNGSDEVSLIDSTPNGNTLTNNGGVALGTGKINGCAAFSVNYFSREITTSANWSLGVWVKPTSIPDYGPIANIVGIFNFYLNTDQSVSVNDGVAASNIESVGSVPIDSWSHVVVTRAAGTTTLFINGASVASTTQVIQLSGTIQFGAFLPASWYFYGSLDEVGIWNRALSSTEVAALYNEGAGLSYPFPSVRFFNAAVNGNLATLGNWWNNSGFTIPADALPDNSDAVVIAAPPTSGTATYGSATITANIGSAVSITANEITLNSGINSGTLIGPVVLNNSSSNAGTITGNATIYNPSANPIGGVVTGSETYLWPNGTGLWGGDVWINGDIAFIIPEPSDVRSGVEYGPASDPYVGTFSGGGGAATFRQTLLPRLLKLPFPIKI